MSGTTLTVPVTVTGLQGKPLPSAAPAAGNGLLFDGTAWSYEGIMPAPASPAAGDALVYNGTAWVAAELAARNFIDNSGFTVNQRGYTTGTALAPNAYGFDRWKAGGSGCTLSFTATPASTIVTIGSGSIIQVVEGASLLTGNYTLSWNGTAVCSVGALTNVASPVQVGAAAGSDLIITFSGGTLGQVQLQIGTVATPWQPQPAQVELARCQRFYATAQASATGGYSQSSGNSFTVPQVFPVTMRAAPTITVSGTLPGGFSSWLTSQITAASASFGGVSNTTGWQAFTMTWYASADL